MPNDDFKNRQREDSPVELENQFILRLPPTPSAALRAAVRSGVMNLKERLTIQLEPDVRHGTVKFDKWYLSSKVMDLPCLLESHKTLDRKTFYKTADISQIMICKEEDETAVKPEEEDTPTKKKDKKENKDKKFLWPHGITPPLKNVRKRRFRKTLKKKYVDFPEIEKEVKRLFRMDNEAIAVRYEVVNADDEKTESRFVNPDGNISGSMTSPRAHAHINSNSQSFDVAEHDIFGEVLSSSDDERRVNIVDSGEEESLYPGTSTQPHRKSRPRSELVTEFAKGMLDSPGLGISDQSQEEYPTDNVEAAAAASASETLAAEQSLNQLVKDESDNSGLLMVKLAQLEQEIGNIQARRQTQELDIAAIENQALKQRFQNIIDNLKAEEADKQMQYDEIVSMLDN